jgi:SAM-dependent methyltransferase
MTRIEKMNDVGIGRQNIAYYDDIAADYDAILDQDSSNAVVRAKVADTFITLVKSGTVLDFGGGTGRDLEWLLQNKYCVAFCEPSRAMREIAMDRNKNEVPGTCIYFLDDGKTDFRSWNDSFPFEQKVNAVLANFAVINCIPDIGLFFKKLALVTKKGGTVVALILENSLMKRLRSNLRGTIKSFFSVKPVYIIIDFKGLRQVVYIHSTRSIKKAVAGHFEFMRFERLHKFGFSLIHLVRK